MSRIPFRWRSPVFRPYLPLMALLESQAQTLPRIHTVRASPRSGTGRGGARFGGTSDPLGCL